MNSEFGWWGRVALHCGDMRCQVLFFGSVPPHQPLRRQLPLKGKPGDNRRFTSVLQHVRIAAGGRTHAFPSRGRWIRREEKTDEVAAVGQSCCNPPGDTHQWKFACRTMVGSMWVMSGLAVMAMV